jgi:predicted nucleic acid-binding protein
MPILINTTVLSNLAAVNRLDLLAWLHDDCYVASAVYEEIQLGRAEGYKFLTHVDEAFDAGGFTLVTLASEDELQQHRALPPKLHRGEAMSLAIAHCRGWRFLTDDQAARAYAERLQVSCSGTLGVLLHVIRQGHLTLDEGNALLHKMITHAKYRSPVRDLRILLEEDV